MPNSLALVLMGLVEMPVGCSIYRHGPALVRQIQAALGDEADRRGWSDTVRLMARWQLFIAKLAGVMFFAGGVVTLVTLGHPEERKARWMVAASYDRWLTSQGQPQKYGTQFWGDQAGWRN